jgi:hypothetical protein
VVHALDPSSRKVWIGAVIVLLDVAAASHCADRALPRRGPVVAVIACPGGAGATVFSAAGANRIRCDSGRRRPLGRGAE